ncbi:DHH family phosphoesterase [Salisediminibacterium halotolerans]|uniref:DHH family phosphoesterase n=1 Tax=Salisediminibacterium halotolerans TaxID=517425 RepID=UPI000EAF36EA|nr:DHH family phosphoesterase [Salisediminibacterium halotolerans]RLJ69715.1 c-di-AMP phosphodiesterase-like protein [Actinophytocola xinjiangensis]RPE89773.1 c-di-AMP phosphodiesterase-like protein [Salisediminibacterium halotolerans]TWG32609.1 c-di-AMP phosphodiesterase-like protein [Salisediminibacterium halotolerans]GEL07579.1 cyclic-di-AMP phosphodiesterase GdpP [Salisediminibacterium halotolerans]
MPNNLLKRWHGYHVIALLIMSALFSFIITLYQWELGAAAFVLLLGVFYFTIKARSEFERDLSQYISTLSYRVNKAGEEAVTELPLGMLLYNENQVIQWVNPFLSKLAAADLQGQSLEKLSPELLEQVNENEKVIHLDLYGHTYRIQHNPNERLLYFFNVTEEQEYKLLYENDQTAIGFIYLDNYDEVTQGLEDQVRSRLLAHVTDTLNQWSRENDILIRRTASDRFIAIFNQGALKDLEDSRFTLLDDIREKTAEEKVSLTLSIGIGSGEPSLRELGNLAQSSLDLALGRGGDQVAIKEKNGKVRFYGGKSNAVEKRTRVRARVISHAIRDFIKESDKVYIMGHKNPDMDSIGSAIGMLKIAETNGKDGYIIVDPEDMNQNVQKLLEEVEGYEDLWSSFMTPEEAREYATEETLLVVVDTHKPSLVVEEKLVDEVERTIVIDHHRRGEDFIAGTVLVYMEPYASSTAELVTELLEYQPANPRLGVFESTALLAGIIVDTKSFAIRTGARTFDAASYLRSRGADTVLVQKLLKEDLAEYVKRAKLVENAYIYTGGMAIAKGDSAASYNQVLIAQAADTLLTMNDVVASFVISKLKDGRVSISARSLGDVNVQLIMEKLDGGGHLTNAATQLEAETIEEVEEQLKTTIDEYFMGGDSS